MHGSGKKLMKLKIEKQSEDSILKNVRNFFRLKKENKVIKYRVIRDITNLFKQKRRSLQTKVGNFHSNNYIEYE